MVVVVIMLNCNYGMKKICWTLTGVHEVKLALMAF